MPNFNHDLILMNNELLSAHDKLVSTFSAPKYPVTFILTQPRAASTLFNQLLFTRYNIGYVSNIISRFWLAPSFGVALHRELEIEGQGSVFSTGLIPSGVLEPHEWGFFWRNWLKLDKGQFYCDDLDAVDWNGLKKVVAMMEDRFGAPMVYDSPFFHCNIEGISRAFLNAIYLKIYREPFFICNSIINARIARHGNIDGFYGNHPRKMNQILELADPIEQIVMQVYETEKEINCVMENIPEENRLTINYPDMMANPTEIVDIFKYKLSSLGFDLTPRNIDLPNSLPLRDTKALINNEYKNKLCCQFEKYFGYLPTIGSL